MELYLMFVPMFVELLPEFTPTAAAVETMQSSTQRVKNSNKTKLSREELVKTKKKQKKKRKIIEYKN